MCNVRRESGGKSHVTIKQKTNNNNIKLNKSYFEGKDYIFVHFIFFLILLLTVPLILWCTLTEFTQLKLLIMT